MKVATHLSLATLPERKASSLVIVACMACVVGVLLSVLAVTVGLLRTFEISGSPARAIVYSRDAIAFAGRVEETSTIAPEALAALAGAPGLAKDADGEPMMDAELLAMLPPTPSFPGGSLWLWGLDARRLSLQPRFRIVAGRLFRPGLHELIVGTGARTVFGLNVGDTFTMADGEWPIVGEFSTGGGINDSALMSDAATVMSSLRRQNFTSVLVGLESPAAFDAFRNWVTTNPALTLTAERQSTYYRQIALRTSAFFTAVAGISAFVMALGALFGTIKILQLAIDSRTREIATLSAIGYDPLPIAISVVLEGVILSTVGALVGALLARLLVDGRQEIIWNAIFSLSVSPGLIALGIGWAILLAILGAIIPAIRSARLPVAQALRQA
jgi:putative ABC transport system permease protein